MAGNIAYVPSKQARYLIFTNHNSHPIVLRSVLWLLRHLLPRSEQYRSWNETIQFVLDYPRRVYINVFPAAHTWWLLLILIALTGMDWLSFNVFNMTNQAVISIPFSFREAVGFFQSISIRLAGFSVVPISTLAVGTQVISVVMMYISAYPVLIPLRSSNVYEERSLGIYKGNLETRTSEEAEDGVKRVLRRLGIETKLFFLRQQLQHQLAHDVWWLTIPIIFIVCFEANNYNHDPVIYSVFNIIFKVVSAYGPVGLSTGLLSEAYSLSGGFHTVSKVLICAVMVRGRHRGLPVAIDKAVLLPSEISDSGEGTSHPLQNTAIPV
jgi:Trk-type K+ transport system membrane component